MSCCYSRSMLMAMYPDTEGCKCCHFKRRRDRVMRKKVPVEKVVTTTSKLPCDDVDQLVSLIEGTNIADTSVKNSEAELKKQAKKQRQKQRKELEKREEAERIKKEEEEKARLEEERARAEAEEREEEERRKRREKKKKRKLNKKAAKEGHDVKSAKDVFTPPTPKPSDMVTIRRNPNSSDTIVTFTIHNETGEENLLYTLVNGQVEGLKNKPLSSSSSTLSSIVNPSPHIKKSSQNLPPVGGGKKKKKGSVTVNGISSSLGKENLVLSSSTNTQSHTTAFTMSPQKPPLSLSRSEKERPFEGLTNSNGVVDLSQLRLPAGITLTRINNEGESEDDDENEQEQEKEDPPIGYGFYNQDSNLIVMNSAENADEDEENELINWMDDYPLRGPAPFEEVISTKNKRLRSRAALRTDGLKCAMVTSSSSGPNKVLLTPPPHALKNGGSSSTTPKNCLLRGVEGSTNKRKSPRPHKINLPPRLLSKSPLSLPHASSKLIPQLLRPSQDELLPKWESGGSTYAQFIPPHISTQSHYAQQVGKVNERCVPPLRSPPTILSSEDYERTFSPLHSAPEFNLWSSKMPTSEVLSTTSAAHSPQQQQQQQSVSSSERGVRGDSSYGRYGAQYGGLPYAPPPPSYGGGASSYNRENNSPNNSYYMSNNIDYSTQSSSSSSSSALRYSPQTALYSSQPHHNHHEQLPIYGYLNGNGGSIQHNGTGMESAGTTQHYSLF